MQGARRPEGALAPGSPGAGPLEVLERRAAPRRKPGCRGGRMRRDVHHGLLAGGLPRRSGRHGRLRLLIPPPPAGARSARASLPPHWSRSMRTAAPQAARASHHWRARASASSRVSPTTSTATAGRSSAAFAIHATQWNPRSAERTVTLWSVIVALPGFAAHHRALAGAAAHCRSSRRGLARRRIGRPAGPRPQAAAPPLAGSSPEAPFERAGRRGKGRVGVSRGCRRRAHPCGPAAGPRRHGQSLAPMGKELVAARGNSKVRMGRFAMRARPAPESFRWH